MHHIPEEHRPQVGLCDCHHSNHIHLSCFRTWLSYFLLGHSFNGSPCTITLIWGLQSVSLPILFSYCKTHRFSSHVLWILQGTPYFKALSCHLPRQMKVNDNLNQDSQLTWFNTENISIFATYALSPGQVLTLSQLPAPTETLQWKFQYC